MATYDRVFGQRKKFTKDDREKARERLARELKPGDTVHTILKHVSRSGMLRHVQPVILRDGDSVGLGYSAGALLRESVTDQSVHMHGCGMDMGFALVYNLGMALFPDGFECIGERTERGQRCPSTDHSNGDRNYKPHHHNSGAYALRQRWL